MQNCTIASVRDDDAVATTAAEHVVCNGDGGAPLPPRQFDAACLIGSVGHLLTESASLGVIGRAAAYLRAPSSTRTAGLLIPERPRPPF